MTEKDNHVCSGHGGYSLQQSLDEMEFERGILGAVVSGDEERVATLLKKDPSQASATDNYGFSPLHYAARGGQVGILRRILASPGVDINAKTASGGATPLHRAAYAGRLQCLKILLDHGADPKVVDSDGQTPLHKAGEMGRSEIWQHLIQTHPRLSEIKDSKNQLPILQRKT